jgi:phosphohistidine phosphatase
MKTLLIMRHAKSSWEDTGLSDFERPLNVRGLKTAPFIGELMARNGLKPCVILSSPAVRAKMTALSVKESGRLDAGIRFEHRIYQARPHALQKVVSEIDNNYASAMLVGHNPGIEGLIRYLTGQIEPMPTAAIAVIELDIDRWNDIHDGCGKIRKIHRPKDFHFPLPPAVI